ncbi:LacI family transcriptional regulator [Curtobacterium sp. PhB130]|uniref:LacI family DNA-binding transcriptional regulator n=1 Tax=Curtobacterium sp. PhB130 TaxID=2485178 RepID=UPI000F9DADBD|nr:LacI family DNA-binding transcriptional regulator [Curtobacterium sp. PhB130]ROS75937.1 LacI family transcriptional regulator [Curtobacterium sp. PhB130]
MSTDLSSARRAPSLAAVAEAAGVSMQTVSRVARGFDNVSPETRLRVQAAMTSLGYRPNRAARALRSGRFRTIGVIMFTLASFGNMRTLEAIADAAGAADFTITLLPMASRTEEGVRSAFSRLHEQAVDGVVIIIESHVIDTAEVALPDGVPVVVVDSTGTTEHPAIDTDQAEGARLATQHLLDLGHETVWHVAGPSSSYSSSRRLAAWRSTLTAAGRPVPPVFHGDWGTSSGYGVGLEIARRPEITAVFAANDQTALGILRACHELGRPVPDSLSIVGFDDMPESDSFWPPLTTVHQSFDEVGRRAVSTLLTQIEGAPVTAATDFVPVRLVVRASTAAPPAR